MKSRSMKPCGCARALAISSANVRSSVPRIASSTGLPRCRPISHSGKSSISRRRNASSNGGNVGRRRQLEADQRVERGAHQPACGSRVRRIEHRDARRAAEVGHEHEAGVEVVGQYLGHARRPASSCATWTNSRHFGRRRVAD
jgi:hypothetical protein